MQLADADWMSQTNLLITEGQWLLLCSLSYSPAAWAPAGALQDKTGDN